MEKTVNKLILIIFLGKIHDDNEGDSNVENLVGYIETNFKLEEYKNTTENINNELVECKLFCNCILVCKYLISIIK